MKPASPIAAVLLAACAASAHAALQEDFRCLSSSGPRPISLEFRQVVDTNVEWSGGYVLYKGSKKAIPIVVASSRTTDRPEGRPWAFEDRWVEVFDGRINGVYTVRRQGANITDFTYTSAKDGRVFSFSQDIAHTGTQSCNW
ncbi:hypothetical protein [Pseudacidovorax intermedius]|uniref:hypothetical protein n=1 Tax=Pseudacidovorax intermedius TaxID=433924 RepID=UPI001B20B7EF|nr:hypothetical protein [Pseudacidovorax intermedius]MBO9642999.1 hypothetical protein [Pseudacidovorax sp.]